MRTPGLRTRTVDIMRAENITIITDIGRISTLTVNVRMTSMIRLDKQKYRTEILQTNVCVLKYISYISYIRFFEGLKMPYL